MFVFGRGEYGRLGLGNDRSRATPVKVTYGTRCGTVCVKQPWLSSFLQLASMEGAEVVQATTGGTHTMLLSAARDVYVMGRGSLGRLGLGTFFLAVAVAGCALFPTIAAAVGRKQAQHKRTRRLSGWTILGSRSQECKFGRYE